ncbi:MAG: YhbY family RNA-binding protein [Oscillospiraceae bacterium]
MITGKQRAQLRAMANGLDTIAQVGKGGMSDALIKQTDEALTAREIIKLRVLENSGVTAKEAAIELAEQTDSEVVQVIGTRFVLYRKNPKDTKIKLIKE